MSNGDAGTRKRTDADKIISMLERRERAAKMAYEEARDTCEGWRLEDGEEKYAEWRVRQTRASARYTEAQEALSMARMIGG